MSPRHHKLNWTLTILAVLGVVGAIVLITTGAFSEPVGPKSQAVVRVDAMNAAVAAANTPNPNCNPPVGGGRMGICAPSQAFGAANAIAKAAGDPEHISGHPIGVDVSSYQGCSINWARTPVAFMFFKATEGVFYTDPCLVPNVVSAKRAHKPYGTYAFLRPRPGRSPVAEANYFADAVLRARANTSLPPVADVEVNAGLSPKQLNAYVCAWHRQITRRLHRPVTITYTGNWFWGPQLNGDHCGSRLWVSAYAFTPIIPRPWKRYTFWQYSDGVFGPTPRVNQWDTDVFSGSQTQLVALASRAKPVVKPPAPKPVPKPPVAKPPVRHPNGVDRVTCRRLNWWRAHGRPHGKPEHNAVRRKRALTARHLVCSSKGVS